jgi:NACalpha-BTF3-like transcription factor
MSKDHEERVDEEEEQATGHSAQQNKDMDNMIAYDVVQQTPHKVDVDDLTTTLQIIRDTRAKTKAAQLTKLVEERRQAPWSKVQVSPDDVSMLMNECNVSKNEAETMLKMQEGDVERAIRVWLV